MSERKQKDFEFILNVLFLDMNISYMGVLSL